jgi:hypothetical protein
MMSSVAVNIAIGAAFQSVAIGLFLFVFGKEVSPRRAGPLEFFKAAVFFWVIGVVFVFFSTNTNRLLMFVLYSPAGDYTDDLALVFFSMAYASLLIAALRLFKSR